MIPAPPKYPSPEHIARVLTNEASKPTFRQNFQSHAQLPLPNPPNPPSSVAPMITSEGSPCPIALPPRSPKSSHRVLPPTVWRPPPQTSSDYDNVSGLITVTRPLGTHIISSSHDQHYDSDSTGVPRPVQVSLIRTTPPHMQIPKSSPQGEPPPSIVRSHGYGKTPDMGSAPLSVASVTQGGSGGGIVSRPLFLAADDTSMGYPPYPPTARIKSTSHPSLRRVVIPAAGGAPALDNTVDSQGHERESIDPLPPRDQQIVLQWIMQENSELRRRLLQREQRDSAELELLAHKLNELQTAYERLADAHDRQCALESELNRRFDLKENLLQQENESLRRFLSHMMHETESAVQEATNAGGGGGGTGLASLFDAHPHLQLPKTPSPQTSVSPLSQAHPGHDPLPMSEGYLKARRAPSVTDNSLKRGIVETPTPSSSRYYSPPYPPPGVTK